MKLNLGCGNDLKEGYVNIDAVLPCDVLHDLRNPLPYPDNSIDEILANGVIQHVSREEWKGIKKDWVRVLKKGGIMHISCWNFPWVLKEFLAHPDEPYAMQRIYAGQDGEYDYFKNGFTIEKLTRDLQEEGMTNFQRQASGEEFIDLICEKL
jgi:predicted SAM-dependent methyltransferase